MSRKKALLDALDAVEKKSINVPRVNDGDCFTKERRNRQSNVDKYKNNKNSIFKKPSLPLKRCLPPRTRPDYEHNPEKYIKYSLSDVDISDTSNKAAAFSFLREMEERRTKGCEFEEGPSQQKIVFQNSTKLRSTEDSHEKFNDGRIQGNKFLMSEYVIGERKQKSKVKRTSTETVCKKSQLKLSHLDEENDE